MGHLLIGHGSMAVAHTKVDYPRNALCSVIAAEQEPGTKAHTAEIFGEKSLFPENNHLSRAEIKASAGEMLLPFSSFY